MVKKICCVVGCKSERTPYYDVSFHKFPQNQEIRAKWLEVLTVETVDDNKLVCGLHFKKEQFTENSIRRRLKADAVPAYDMDIPEEEDCDIKLSASEIESDMDNTFGPSSPLSNGSDEIKHPAMSTQSVASRPADDLLTPMLPVTIKYIMCRICLAKEGDRRLYHMNENNILYLYEQVTGVQVGESRPQHVCWECGYRLQTFFKFRNRALQANSLLQTLPSENSFMLISNTLKEHLSSKLKMNSIKTRPDYEYIFKKKIKKEEYLSDMGGDISDSLDEDSIIEKIYLEIEEPDVKIEINKSNTKSYSTVDETKIESGDDMSTSLKHTTNEEFDDDTVWICKNTTRDDEDSDDDVMWPSKDSTKYGSDNEMMSPMKDDLDNDTVPNQIYKTPPKILQSLLTDTQNNSYLQKKTKSSNGTVSIDASKSRKKTSNKNIQKKIVLNRDIIDIKELSYDEQISNMLKKMDSSGFKKAMYKCMKCYRGYMDVDMYNWHMSRHDIESGPYECGVCKLRYKWPGLLRLHMFDEHLMRFSCKICSFVTSRRQFAKLHECWHNGATFQCPYCPRAFTKKSTYFGHIRVKHPSDNACDQCGYMFLGTRGVAYHKKLKHKFDEKPLEGPYCEVCDVKFATQEVYDRHLRLSSKHSSDQDPNRLPNSAAYKSLQSRRSKSPSYGTRGKRRQNTPLECEQCGLEVPNLLTYSQHFRRSHPGRPRVRHPPTRARPDNVHMCEQCGKTFNSPCLLRHHMWVHEGGSKPYACDECDKTFTQKSSLISHKRTLHVGPRTTYPCPECGKHFAFKFNMVKHTFIHTGLKPFECESCGKCFRTVHQRQAHFDHVHLNKPWPSRPDRHRRRTKPKREVED